MNQENNLLHENNTFQFTDWLLRLIVKSSFEMRIRQGKSIAYVFTLLMFGNLFLEQTFFLRLKMVFYRASSSFT